MASWRKAVTKMFTWLLNGTRILLYTVFGVVSAIGLWHACTTKGNVEDRRTELRRLEDQLLQAKMRGDELDSRLHAMTDRQDVRRQVIRAELGMLGENEKFFVFK